MNLYDFSEFPQGFDRQQLVSWEDLHTHDKEQSWVNTMLQSQGVVSRAHTLSERVSIMSHSCPLVSDEAKYPPHVEGVLRGELMVLMLLLAEEAGCRDATQAAASIVNCTEQGLRHVRARASINAQGEDHVHIIVCDDTMIRGFIDEATWYQYLTKVLYPHHHAETLALQETPTLILPKTRDRRVQVEQDHVGQQTSDEDEMMRLASASTASRQVSDASTVAARNEAPEEEQQD